MIPFLLIRSLSFSHLRHEKTKGFLTVAGMCLGIAVFAGMQFANQNVFKSFESSVQALTGKSPAVIVARGPRIQEKWLPELFRIDPSLALVPQSTRVVEAFRDGESLGRVRMVGIDTVHLRNFQPPRRRDPQAPGERSAFLNLLNLPGAAAISPALHDTLDGENFQILVNTDLHFLEPVMALEEGGISRVFSGQVAVMDIARFQDLFSDHGFIDRLLVFPENGLRFSEFKEAVERVSDGNLTVEKPGDHAAFGRKMTEAFRLNLQFLAAISLLVGALLIYNSVSYAILKRRRELGILRTLGARSRTLFFMILSESAAIGLVSAALGVGLGYLLSAANTGLISTTLSNLYFPVQPGPVRFSPAVALQCLFLGPAVAVAGSLAPALEIFRIQPRKAFSYQNVEQRFLTRLRLFTFLGTASLVLAVIFSHEAWLHHSLWMGFLPPAFLILGLVMLVPAGLKVLVTAGKTITGLRFGIEVPLALDHIRVTLRRNSVAVASAMIAIGMYLGVSMMILSFRGTVDGWIQHVTRADVFISSPYRISGRSGGYLPESMIQELTRHPAVRNYDWVSTVKAVYQGREIRIAGMRFEIFHDDDRLLFKEAMGKKDRETLPRSDEMILVSESFSNHFQKKTGDRVLLPAQQGRHAAVIKNVFYDYSSDQGVVYLPWDLFTRLFEEDRKQGMAIYLKPGTSPKSIRNFVRDRYPEQNIVIRDNESLRREVMAIFDQTFKVTYILQFIALIIAAAVILNTILMLTLERSREFGVFRAIGARRSSIIKMVSAEALLLGTASFIGGLITGLLLAVILVFVVNKFFFGWSVTLTIPVMMILASAAAILTLSFLAGLLPGIQASRSVDAEALRYE